MRKTYYIHGFVFALLLLSSAIAGSQKPASVFQYFDFGETDSFRLSKPLQFYEILCSKTGFHKFTSSFGLLRDKGTEIEMIFYTVDDKNKKLLKRNYIGENGIRTMYENAAKIVFFVSHDNRILWQPGDGGGFGYAPFNFPPKENPGLTVTKIWIDKQYNLYIGTLDNNFYFSNGGARMSAYEADVDTAGVFRIKSGEKFFKQVILSPGTSVYSFADDPVDSNIAWIGTNRGIFQFNKSTRHHQNILSQDSLTNTAITVTNLEAGNDGNIWFSTLEKGLGYYEYRVKKITYFFYPKKNGHDSVYPVKTFCRKSKEEFFVAVMDSLPAVFNITTAKYSFIQDSIFNKTKNGTTDIKLDGFGNLFLVKGGGIFYTDFFKESKPFAFVPLDSLAYTPFIKDIQVNGIPYSGEGNADIRSLRSIRLKYNQNSLTIGYSIAELVNRNKVEFAWMAEGYINEWVSIPVKGDVNLPAMLNGLGPGRYIFRVKARVGNEDWRQQMAQLIIIITPPIWQTWWFWLAMITGLSLIIFTVASWRAKAVRKQEREKARHEKELLEMEARALRAQMNPHFIFNCMNSIKALIHADEKQKSVEYLTTFSKLIRTLFQNSDKRQISLYDEITTCQLYTRLEMMRLNGKLNCSFDIDPDLDLKSVMVPALIVQPFIENAIWHGIVPKDGGSIRISIKSDNEIITCEVIDDGIGRELSKRNKPITPVLHESKGVHLSQTRLSLEKLLNDTNGSIEIIDMYEQQTPIGTKVVITFNLQ